MVKRMQKELKARLRLQSHWQFREEHNTYKSSGSKRTDQVYWFWWGKLIHLCTEISFHRSFRSWFIHFLCRPQGGKDCLVLGSAQWREELESWVLRTEMAGAVCSTRCPWANRNHRSMRSVIWKRRLYFLPVGGICRARNKTKIRMPQQKMGFQVESIKGQVFMCSKSPEPNMDWWHFTAPLMIHAAKKPQKAAGAGPCQRTERNCFLVNRVIWKVFVPSC